MASRMLMEKLSGRRLSWQVMNIHMSRKCPIHDARGKGYQVSGYTVDMELPGMLYAQMLFSLVGACSY